ncbi:related to alpha-tubulin suppressor [Ramularia collo-cygni]|uniref:Related to alpha-tubulin suppressor n=1 Tax=Ramularia collo-cygni TaxID=112498 RepID=A0A2D3UXN3_9PEZI|nr:related to alpha-tubulin suppressor [Ramularia collo-cygni]CZT15906.1 related to alpha-tubulin suppressor [Ramularia collo-cygni]
MASNVECRAQLFAFGSNGSGQLGIGHTEDVSVPHPVLGCLDVQQIACGGNHTIVTGKHGLATSGENSDGRCFTASDSSTNNSLFLHSDKYPEAMVAATWSASFICSAGSVHACGAGNAGELGLGPGVQLVGTPQAIANFPPVGTKIVKIAACMAHVVVVLTNGEVWGWGKGRKGQLDEPAATVWSPRKFKNIGFFAVDAVCGKDFTCIFGSPSTGELFVTGPNSNDRFGVKTNAPANVRGWKKVAASWGSVFVLSESGDVTAWGRNDHGQLPPVGLPPLSSIVAGSEHCLGLTEAGKVLAWGWGEHGNCGDPTDAKGDVKNGWNEIALSRPASAIFAGCATSFVVAD